MPAPYRMPVAVTVPPLMVILPSMFSPQFAPIPALPLASTVPPLMMVDVLEAMPAPLTVVSPQPLPQALMSPPLMVTSLAQMPGPPTPSSRKALGPPSARMLPPLMVTLPV